MAVVVVCAICSQLKLRSSCQQLDKNFKDIIDDLQIKLNETICDDSSYICLECVININKAFNFKCTCIYTEDTLVPYIPEGNSKIDMKNVFMEETRSTSTDQEEICRLCLKSNKKDVVISLLTLLEQHNYLNIFKKHIPQVSLDLVDNPFICNECLKQLKEFENFATRVSKITDETKFSGNKLTVMERNCDDDLKNENQKVEMYEDHISDEEELKVCNKFLEKFKFAMVYAGENLVGNSKIPCYNSGYSTENKLIRTLDCKICHFQTRILSEVRKHYQTHYINMKPLLCLYCGYKTRKEFQFLAHLKKHSTCLFRTPCFICTGSSDVKNIYAKELIKHECISCQGIFKKDKASFIFIMDETKSYECDKCKLVLQHEKCFKQHKKSHLGHSHCGCQWCNTNFFKCRKGFQGTSFLNCQDCSYVTDCKADYHQHIQQHMVNTCEHCCQSKINMIFQHTLDEQLRLHRCQVCYYKAPCKYFLQKHLEKIHKMKPISNTIRSWIKISPVDQQMEKIYQCQMCFIEICSINKMKDHMATMHNITSKSNGNKQAVLKKKMHNCCLCKFRSGSSACFNLHMNEHTIRGEKYLKCEICEYVGRNMTYIKKHMIRMH